MLEVSEEVDEIDVDTAPEEFPVIEIELLVDSV